MKNKIPLRYLSHKIPMVLTYAIGETQRIYMTLELFYIITCVLLTSTGLKLTYEGVAALLG